MKTIVIVIATALLFLAGPPAQAMDGHGGMSGSGHASSGKDAMGFKHDTVVDGVRFEFQIMSLASMNMQDAQGRTHHIMVKMVDEDTRAEIKDAVGKIKIIGPDGAEQVNTLENYSGIFATNFSLPAQGKYGVICLLMVDGQKKLVRFWYDHKA